MNLTTATQAPRRSWLSPYLLLAVSLLATPLRAEQRFLHEGETVDRVFALIDRRLALMPEVAAAIFHQQKPIADPARERDVIEQASTDAEAAHLDREAARAFFSVQIQMARAVQAHFFARWHAGGGHPPAARDLATEIRPQLDAIGRESLPVLFLASTALSEMPAAELSARAARLRRHEGVTPELLADLVQALRAMRITRSPTWESLRRVGVLRVGTTGDYAPFSDDRSGGLQGVDIRVAEALARSWDVTVVFVQTSWPTLMEDLGRRRFDVALSGISITPERSRHADFSTPYVFDGKMPIVRRDDAARYGSLESIDQPGVRVIVNPGGTNERFVREHIKHASITVHPDNRTIFDEIIAGRADVMITDSIEVRLQSRRHPELQAARTESFTRVGKAILLPSGSELTTRLDAWLAPFVERGEIARQLEAELDDAR